MDVDDQLPEYGNDHWIIVPNWDRFQHYKERNPPWIKVYSTLLSNADFLDLSLPARGLLVTIWLAYARNSGQLRVKVLRKFCRSSGSFMHKSQLDSLLRAGLLDISASKPLAPKKEKEIEIEKTVLAPKREEIPPLFDGLDLLGEPNVRASRRSNSGAYTRFDDGVEKPTVDPDMVELAKKWLEDGKR